MLTRPDPKKVRQRWTAHKQRTRRRKKLGLVHVAADVDQVTVEMLLEEHGLLPSCVDHTYAELQRAWQKYIDIILKPEA